MTSRRGDPRIAVPASTVESHVVPTIDRDDEFTDNLSTNKSKEGQ
jgi:hypothetical protein